MITTLDGGVGDDNFQIGQVFGADPNVAGTDVNGFYPSGVAVGDEIDTTQITRGFLSNGISVPLVAYGAEGDDTFTVFSNTASLRLEGEGGDDSFLIRAFVSEDEAIVNGGGGDDFFEYNINAPVSINGGAGNDRVVAVGTEADDTFVITDEGIFGAGVNIQVDGVEEAIEVDGLEGDDTFFVLSTRPGVVNTLIGGLGSDTVNVLSLIHI